MVDNYEAIKKQMYIEATFNSAVLMPVCAIAPCPPCGMNKKEKGNNPMDDKVFYLKNRIDEIAYAFDIAFEKQFGVGVPQTFADLVTAITDGKYTAPTDVSKRYGIFDGVKWGDQAGYALAIAAMKVQKKIATDTVMVKDPATDGLAALQAFEAWTYTAPTTA